MIDAPTGWVYVPQEPSNYVFSAYWAHVDCSEGNTTDEEWSETTYVDKTVYDVTVTCTCGATMTYQEVAPLPVDDYEPERCAACGRDDDLTQIDGVVVCDYKCYNIYEYN